MINYIGKCLLVENLERKILVIGDLHLGYEESLNLSGVMVSRHLYDEMINYLDQVFEKIGNVNEIILLGDVKHHFGKIILQEWNDFMKLTNYLKEKSEKIIIIKGNHDKMIEPVAKRAGIETIKFYKSGEILFLHGDVVFDEINDKNVKKILMGHWHPAVEISDGVKVEKYKCFLIGKNGKKDIIILPSFFGGSVGTDLRDGKFEEKWKMNLKKFNVKVVSDEGLEVMDFGILEKI